MTTRRTSTPPENADPQDIDDDAREARELELDPMRRLDHENWPDAVKEAALSHLATGRSMRSTARLLGVPHSTLQSWRLSADPVARRLRAEKIEGILDKVWTVSDELIDKVRTAPVGSARDGAIAFAALTERGIQLSHMATVVNADNGKGTLADWIKLVDREKARQKQERLRATVVPPPES